ncbi:MAG: hypothetical protein II966_06865 [Lachnospiraceae bacterium]|nr:hypothetical protein [Lachnospiraceae bacterium]
MPGIGIDVGSTYTKYCIAEDEKILKLFAEKTPLRQRDYFERKLEAFKEEYPGAMIFSCGYGKSNVSGIKSVNELTALAAGFYKLTGESGTILDIGGQDTKIITEENGRLKDFFINDKCAAGSGMFLTNTLELTGVSFEDIDLKEAYDSELRLSSTCAVFAQSEIVMMIADNRTEEEIINAVIRQILIKAKPLLEKTGEKSIYLSGGLSLIPGIAPFAEKILKVKCKIPENGIYLSAIGCAFMER